MSIYEQQGIGAVIERSWNNSLKQLATKTWSGFRQVANANFGKWALITAGAIMASAALLFGAGAAMGMLSIHTVSSLGLASATNATVGQGITIGVSQAAYTLAAHPVGWAALLGGGFFGARAENKAAGRLTSQQAEILAMQYEISRSRQPQRQLQPDEIPANGHLAAQTQRRTRATDNQRPVG